jgi:hypothetical protein
MDRLPWMGYLGQVAMDWLPCTGCVFYEGCLETLLLTSVIVPAYKVNIPWDSRVVEGLLKAALIFSCHRGRVMSPAIVLAIEHITL